MNPDIEAVLSGRARYAVVCADNREVLPSLGDGAVDHCLSDPPFTQRTSENARTSAWSNRGGRYIGFDGIDPEDYCRSILDVARRWVVLFCAVEQFGDYARLAGESWVRAGIWVRENGAPQFTGDRPAQACEGLAIMHRPGRKAWNGGGMRGVWTHPVNKDGGEIGHPTPKPLGLMLELVELFTDPDDVVLDPFAGSGTTGVACLRLGRRFIGIEKDAKWAQIAIDRLTAESRGQSLREYRAGQLGLFTGDAK